MHELSVMNYLLEAVEEQAQLAGASQVLAINLVVGERAGIVDDSLLFYFDMLTPGTLVEGARLNMRRTTMRFFCQQCQEEYTCEAGDFRCPQCQTFGQLVDDGSDLFIESIEVKS